MATLTTLVGGMQTALTAGLFPASACFYAFDPRKSLSYPPTDQFAAIQPGKVSVKKRTFPTGGNHRLNMIVSLDLTLWLYVRLAVDEYNRSDSYLLNQTLGSLKLTDSVIDTLQAYYLTEGGNVYGYELDAVTWQTEERDGVGWAVTKMSYHTDITGRT